MSDQNRSKNDLLTSEDSPKLESVAANSNFADRTQTSFQARFLNKITYVKLFFAVLVSLIGIYYGKTGVQNYLDFETTNDAQVLGHTMILNSKVGGIITKVNFGDNAEVKKGDVIFVLDNREFLNSIRQLEAETKALEAKYWFADTELKRFKLPLSKDEVSQRQYNLQKSQTDEAFALLNAKKSLLEQAKLNLEYTEVKAPADGRIGRIEIEPGLAIRPQQSMAKLLDNRKPWIVANFKETQLQNIRMGQKTEVEIDAIENKVFSGVVESIAPGSGSSFSLIPPENATGNFTKIVQRVAVKIVLDSESIAGFENRIIPGISAFAKVRVRPEATSK